MLFDIIYDDNDTYTAQKIIDWVCETGYRYYPILAGDEMVKHAERLAFVLYIVSPRSMESFCDNLLAQTYLDYSALVRQQKFFIPVFILPCETEPFIGAMPPIDLSHAKSEIQAKELLQKGIPRPSRRNPSNQIPFPG